MAHYIFIDVNGTLVSDNAKNAHFTDEQVQAFASVVHDLSTQDVVVGLCSDTPAVQLSEFATRLGLSRNVVLLAENGNLFFDGSETHVVRSLAESDREALTKLAEETAQDMFLEKVDGVVASEFTDVQYDFTKQWGVGANRVSSISVFGPPEFITELGKRVDATLIRNGSNFGVDVAPAHNYLGVHPDGDFRRGKARSAQWLMENGQELGVDIESFWMVGDSMSDWMGEDNAAISTLYVRNPKVTEEVMVKAYDVSSRPLFDGVLDCMRKIEKALSRTVFRGGIA